MKFEQQLATGLEDLRQRKLQRILRPLQKGEPMHIQRGGRTLLNFAANDYLGLADHPKLREAALRSMEIYGFGSGGSRLICGSLLPHQELEEEIAVWKRTEAALSFSSGYATAVGAVPALVGAGDVVILDKLSHASLIDGARLSKAEIRVFPHNDVERLRHHLIWARKKRSNRILIVTESIFSMDGDRCPLKEIIALKNQFGAVLLLDEAHAVGVLGKTGAGLAEAEDCTEGIEIQMGTLSKAVGASGGYVCGSKRLIETLINGMRSFIFSTAPPACVAAAAREGVRLIKNAEGARRRKLLWHNVESLSKTIGVPGTSPILIWKIGEESKALAISAWLEAQGYLAPAIRYPSVPKNSARIRFTVSAAHTQQGIQGLAQVMKNRRIEVHSETELRSKNFAQQAIAKLL